MQITPEFLALCVVAVVAGLDRFGLLDRWKKKSPADAAGELAIAERKIERLEHEIAEWKANTPIFELLAENAKTQSQILDRLIHHNGAFKHVEETLGHIDESFKLMTGFIAGLVDLPLKHPSRGGSL